jgi:hypothetical protein
VSKPSVRPNRSTLAKLDRAYRRGWRPGSGHTMADFLRKKRPIKNDFQKKEEV